MTSLQERLRERAAKIIRSKFSALFDLADSKEIARALASANLLRTKDAG